MDTESVLEHALKYAQLGLKVIPVTYARANGSCSCGGSGCKAPGKHPAIKGWKDTATTDATIIKKWFEGDPKLNVGIKLGDGLTVLDVDPRNGGDESLKKLLEQMGNLPITPTVDTGGGGQHYYFKVDGSARNTTSFFPGLDTKGDNAFIVAPPSIHASGKNYLFKEGRDFNNPVATMPAALVQLIGKSQEVKRVSNQPVHSASSPKKIEGGTRNSALYAIGASLVAKGVWHESIGSLLVSINQTQCDPPLDDTEIATVINNCVSYTKPQEKAHNYLQENGRTFYLKFDNGKKPVQIELADFIAQIDEEKIIDDGVEQRTVLVISGKHEDGFDLPPIELAAERFNSMGWVNSLWGSSPIISPGSTNRDHLRTAIQIFSKQRFSHSL